MGKPSIRLPHSAVIHSISDPYNTLKRETIKFSPTGLALDDNVNRPCKCNCKIPLTLPYFSDNLDVS